MTELTIAERIAEARGWTSACNDRHWIDPLLRRRNSSRDQLFDGLRGDETYVWRSEFDPEHDRAQAFVLLEEILNMDGSSYRDALEEVLWQIEERGVEGFQTAICLTWLAMKGVGHD